MSWKAFFLIILIIFLGAFIWLKLLVLGSPSSSFNRTTRYVLGKNLLVRKILGLHSVGDARAEYLQNRGQITIEWFAPVEENIDQGILTKFSDAVGKYTGRPTKVLFGGNLESNTIQISGLNFFKQQADVLRPSGSTLLVFLPEDYAPRPNNELSSTYQESGMLLSLTAHWNFLQSYPDNLNQYLLSSMLHEFGNQIGLNETAAGSPDCIMNLHAGINGQPVEASVFTEPQDFCPAEQHEITNIKWQLPN